MVQFTSAPRFIQERNNLKDLSARLHKLFESDNVDIEEVKSVMNSYQGNPDEWAKFAKYDKDRYTRNLVDEGNGKFNLMILVWAGGCASPVHDHSDAHCVMKMLEGSLNEVRYAWPQADENERVANGQENEMGKDQMEIISTTQLTKENVCYINDSIGLHRVENSSQEEVAVSLHLYSPPFSSCSMFDQQTGKRTKCNVTFWSKFGEKLN